MNLDDLKQMVQTFGSHPKRWPADESETAGLFADSFGAASAVLAQEKVLDDKLDLFVPPFNPGLSARLYAAIINEQNKHLFFVFLRHSTWISLLFLVCGFYFGWHEARENYANTTSYFNDMFNYTTMEL